jgi:hypothetical protein
MLPGTGRLRSVFVVNANALLRQSAVRINGWVHANRHGEHAAQATTPRS